MFEPNPNPAKFPKSFIGRDVQADGSLVLQMGTWHACAFEYARGALW